MSERLNKFLALNLGISRREADNLIEKGDVSINDQTAVLGNRLEQDDKVSVKGKPINTLVEHSYLMFNKPVGYVCSRKKQGDNPTIYDLIPRQYHNLKPVGRLDKDSSGLILLTNDGDFAFQMTHPKFYKTKVYHVKLDEPLQPLHQQMISDFGVDLEDGKSQLGLASETEDRKSWTVTMHEGRNRQIRRTFSALGYTVTKLHRSQFGKYDLGELKSGGLKIIEP